jgi:GntR family transcriptional regulator
MGQTTNVDPRPYTSLNAEARAPHGKARVTVDEVKQAVTQRISAGVHPAGSRLPTVRDLADELGANRNTVNKAYRQLCDAGVIALSPSHKSFVVGEGAQLRGAGDQLQRAATELVWQAMAAGVPRQQMMDDLMSVVADVYESHRLRMTFIECNEMDSAEMADELTHLVGETVEACLLDNALRRAASLARRNDLVITTFHHLAEVSRAFGQHADRVIGVDTRPSPDTLLRIARITSQDIGLVCTLDNTARTLRHIINSYHPDHTVDVALIDDPNGIKRVARTSGHVVVTHTAADVFRRVAQRQPDVVVQFRVDEQSIAYLKQRMRQVRLGDRRPSQLTHATLRRESTYGA